jgi:hypothetical protein
MQSLSELFKIARCAETRVYCVDILLPVSMVCFTVLCALLDILGDGGNPDGVKAHILDVIELSLDP